MHTLTAFPKSIEGVPYRWISQPLSVASLEGRTYKRGGRTAVMHCPVPGFDDVLIYQPDGEDWWDQLPPDTAIRAAIRGPARNGADLIGYALPLRNQPSELQRHMGGVPQQLEIPEPAPWAEAIQEGREHRQRSDRQRDRRPRGTTDEELMLMVERIAKAHQVRACDAVNMLLREAIDNRLRGTK